MSNANHAIQDLHDILHSYYKVARQRFVDSLRMQAANCYLTTGPSTSLKLLSPAFVAEMTPEQMEDVAIMIILRSYVYTFCPGPGSSEFDP